MMAGAEVGSRDGDGRTPLHDAVHSGYTETARVLLHTVNPDPDRDPHPDRLFSSSCSPCPFLADSQGIDIIDDPATTTTTTTTASVVSSSAAVVNVRDNDGCTPLHEAVGEGHFETSRLLLEHGADVHAADALGFTALYVAASIHDERLCALLAEAGGTHAVEEAMEQASRQQDNGLEDEAMALLRKFYHKT